MKASPHPSKHADNSRAGILYMLLAMLTFSIVNALAKDAAARYPVVQIVFFRNVCALMPCLLWLGRSGGFSALRTQHLRRHMLCGFIGAFGLWCCFTSLQLLPLANAITIHFSSTLFLTAFSALFLKEVVNYRRWLAIGIGFAGVLAMTRPTHLIGEAMGVGVALIFALIDSMIMLNARILTRTDNSAAVVIYFALFASIAAGCALPFIWQTPTVMDAVLLGVMGVGGGLGQLFLTQAYRHAPAATVSPMIYSALIWSMGLGFMFWGDIPDLSLLFGAGLIIASGLFIIYEEAMKRRTITAIPPQGMSELQK